MAAVAAVIAGVAAGPPFAVTAIGAALIAAYVYLCGNGAEQRRRAHAAIKALEKRRRQRARRLDDTAGIRSDLDELTALVDTMRAARTCELGGDELEDLLDLYVDAANGERAYLRHLMRAPLSLSEISPDDHSAVRTRTIAWLQRCAEHVRTCRERQEDITELLRLYSQRTTLPEVDHLLQDDLIDRQLAELAAERSS